MNTKVSIIAILLNVFMGINLQAQQSQEQTSLFNYEGKNKTHHVGFYADLGVSFGDNLQKSSFWLDGKAGLVWNQHWAFGFAGSALNYDHKLSKLVNDGTYRMEAGYSGIFVEYIAHLSDWARVSGSLITGQGVAQYRYDKEFAEARQWYEELIDRETFAVFQPGLECQVKVYNNWWLAASVSYRNTSPVKLLGQKDCFLQGLNYGLSVKYNLY